MSRRTRSDRGMKWGGFLVAVVGFLLTRLTVLDAVEANVPLVQFLANNGVVLVLGLGVTLFGLGLSVSTFERQYVNTVATWCVLGTAGILLITGIAMFDDVLASGVGMRLNEQTSTLLSHALMGGAVGGVLIGIRSATDQRNRLELSRRADQLTVLNRIIRHEVLNASNVIRGHASLLADGDAPDEPRSFAAIERGVSHIDTGVREIGFLTRAAKHDRPILSAVDVGSLVGEAIASVREEYPDVAFAVDGELPGVEVWATAELRNAVVHLLDNAAGHNERADARVAVDVDVGERVVAVRVADNGPGLPEDQRDILLGGDLPEYDDPDAGFGLPLVRLLVDQFGGQISVTSEPGRGTTITLGLVRANQRTPEREAYGLEPRELLVAAGVSVVAGVVMGVVLQQWVQVLPVIGGLYGVQRLSVGWSMHLFHSVVFGVAFAVATDRPPLDRRTASTPVCVALGVAWGVFLWLVAGGFVMPVMLHAAGYPAPIPLLTFPGLVGHVLWGALVGLLFSVVS